MPTVSLVMENQEVKTFNVQSGQVVFDALDDLGHKLPHGCLSGSCSACKMIVLEGEDHLEPASLIEKNTIKSVKETNPSVSDQVVRLACRAKIKGDIKIQSFK